MTDNKTPLIVMAVLVLLLVLASVGFSKSMSMSMMPMSPPPVPGDSRAIIVPTDDAARTVVVPPCNTPPEQTTVNAARGLEAPNAVTLQLPRRAGSRAVLVPDCNKQSGAANAAGTLPAAAFVLPVGVEPGPNMTIQLGVRTQIVVPMGSSMVIVVPPCTNRQETSSGTPAMGGTGQDTVLKPSGRSATAPSC